MSEDNDRNSGVDSSGSDLDIRKELTPATSDDSTSTILPPINREPFLAFVPKVASYFHSILASEASNVQNAITSFPSWSQRSARETIEFYRENPNILGKEVISGFTVAIMQVPESIAFSFVAGVPPLSGLHATFWMAFITGILGGKPGMISGAAGALAVVVADLTVDGGVLDYLNMSERLNVLFMTMFVCGIMQIAMAMFRLAKLVKLIPETGMIGFMNGLAIIIFLAQLPAFQTCDDAPRFVECTLDQRQWLTFQDNFWQLILTLFHVALCMAIMKFFPLIPKIGKIIPASLMGLLIGTLLEHTLFREVFKVATRTVEETAQMSGSLPEFDWPSIPSDATTIRVVFTYGITLAAIGGVESVLTLQACNEITDTVPKISDSNQELFAQGLANLVSGLFRAMGGDAMIGQSTINIMNGARYRISSTMSGIFMLLFVVALSPFINLLPVATLTGVLFMVVLSTFQWKTFAILRYGRLSDSIAVLLVTLIAVFFNLAVAIAAGVVFSALVHAWDSGAHIETDIVHKQMMIQKEENPCEVKYVKVRGTVFFGSARKFIYAFDVANDPKTIVIDFQDALIVDHSAVAAIQGVAHRFEKVDKRVFLINLPKKSHGRMERTGDHDALKRQIISSDHVVGSLDEESQMVMEEDPVTQGKQRQHPQPKNLGELEMFQVSVDGVEYEIDQLNRDQGQVSVHDVNKES